MPIKLQIRKKAGNVWEYVDVDKSETISSSKQHLVIRGSNPNPEVQFTEPYGNDIARFDLSDVAIYDDTASSTEETFTDSAVFADRLKALGNPAFYRSGDLVIADFVSSDPQNALIISPNDGKLFVSSGVDGGTA